MRFIAAVMLSLLPLLATATELKVGPGQSYLVEKNNSQMVLDHLEIADAARIRFAPGVMIWRVQAKTAVIGDNVVIDGRGEAGESGMSGVSASDCKNQLNGQGGAHGAPGTDGVSMRLQLGIQSLGSLKVIADGGRGGDGGTGGDGADNSDDCAGDRGGDGGDGGDGGAGGSGGEVTILYRLLGSDLEPLDVSQRIKVSASPGKGGTGGRGGSNGKGSGGRYVDKKTLAGTRQWISGGEAGLSGSIGLSGGAGANGAVTVESLMMEANSAPTQEEDQATGSLLQRLEDLERRVQTLENAK